ncbi:MAG: hypothetical protein MJA82_15660 [Clostridia bacterium]|nr:hypothetical protein [Clostridia bacterium]
MFYGYGRGYFPEALGAKTFYTEGIHKVKKPKYSISNFVAEKGILYYSSFEFNNIFIDKLEDEKKYGVKISTLIQKIENGEL